MIFDSQSATLTGIPNNNDVGDHSVSFIVSDNLLNTSTQSFTITVVNINDPPYFDPIPDQDVVVNTELIISLNATDDKTRTKIIPINSKWNIQ